MNTFFVGMAIFSIGYVLGSFVTGSFVRSRGSDAAICEALEAGWKSHANNLFRRKGKTFSKN